jgi:heme/copper-type cytochrome/quinol oxidase subunit 2
VTEQALGWQEMAIWRKIIYFVFAVNLGAILSAVVLLVASFLAFFVVSAASSLIGLEDSARNTIVGIILVLAAIPIVIGSIVFMYRWIRSDINYVDSELWAEKNGHPTGSRHWP